MTDATPAGSKLANSVALILISRIAMVAATCVGLPTAYWMLNRSVTTVDKISEKIDAMRDQAMETSGTVKLIQQTQGNQTQMIADHEVRIRAVESLTRNNARN